MVYKKYNDKSFLSDIQNLEDMSGFSFKKINNHSDNLYVFVCSHIKKEFDVHESDHSYFNENSYKLDSENYSFFKVLDFEEIEENTFTFPQFKKINIKRCKFKIAYKKIKGLFILSTKSNFNHCHEPREIYNKFNELKYRNIKLSYDFVLRYFNKLYKLAIKYENNIDLIIINLKKKKKKYVYKYLNSNQKNRKNLNRKIINFLKSLKNILTKNVGGDSEKFFSVKEYIKFFLKQNANSYLRFEDIEKLYDYCK
jgi:hypothetical protein